MKGKRWLIALIPVFLLSACGHKNKVSLSGEDPVDISDFIASFNTISPPYEIADTSVVKRTNDTVLISHKVFSSLIPDSVLRKIFGKEEKSRIYPIGRISAPGGGTYLLIKAFSGEHRAVVILCFDKKNNFIAGMPVLQPDANPAMRRLFSIDKRYTILKTVTRRNSNGTTSEGKDVYVLNEPAKTFLLIMTDALDAERVELINPIESLPKKNKYAGDYVKDKRNLVSIRDSKRANHVNFFVHFERKNNCTGELRGEASFTSPNTVVYRSDGDFCVLQLVFTATSVTVTEVEGCGSHRGVECAFEGTFPKKKEVKKKEIKKTAKKTYT